MRRINRAELDVFVTIARHCSFQRAAEERGVSVPSISRTLRCLEQRLGVRLLNRTTRSVALTEVGKHLLSRLAPAISEISATIDELNDFRETLSGRVKIAVSSSAVQHLLSFLSGSFLKSYPQIEVEITVDSALTDPCAVGFDLGLRESRNVPSEVVSVPFGQPSRFVVVASPNYVSTHGSPHSPADLLKHSTVRRRLPDGSVTSWEFRKDGQAVAIRPTGRLTLGDAYAELQAALGGFGYAYLLQSHAREALASGQLVQALDDWCSISESLSLFYSNNHYMPAHVRALIEIANSNVHRHATIGNGSGESIAS